jgi:hypothetical protein
MAIEDTRERKTFARFNICSRGRVEAGIIGGNGGKQDKPTDQQTGASLGRKDRGVECSIYAIIGQILSIISYAYSPIHLQFHRSFESPPCSNMSRGNATEVSRTRCEPGVCFVFLLLGLSVMHPYRFRRKRVVQITSSLYQRHRVATRKQSR